MGRTARLYCGFLGFVSLVSVGSLRAGDYDRDGYQDPAVWRESDQTVYVYTSGKTCPPPLTPHGDGCLVRFGKVGDWPLDGDWDGDGRSDFIFFTRKGNWRILLATGQVITKDHPGKPGDVPIAADFNNDSRTDTAIYRPSARQTKVRFSGSDQVVTFAESNPTPGTVLVPLGTDLDGDGRAERIRVLISQLRSGSAVNWVFEPTTAPPRTSRTVGYAADGSDIPLIGDLDGDGRGDYVSWSPLTGTWIYVLSSELGRNIVHRTIWGTGGDIPLLLDVDGDGRDDFVVWEPSTGNWLALTTRGAPPRGWTPYLNGYKRQWGLPGDVPLPRVPRVQS